MKKRTAAVVIALLFALSAAIYYVQYLLFHDTRDTGFYLLQDWAFLPVQIAVVTVVAGKIVGDREKQERLSRTRMLASSFFGELGTDLLCRMLPCTANLEEIAPLLRIDSGWSARDFQRSAEAVRRAQIRVSCTPQDLERLRQLLQAKRLPMLVIASNPALLEHEAFTDMLWSIFHLSDEFSVRGNFAALPPEEIGHLNDDVRRALTELLVNWFCHMSHIKAEYPYLFALEVRRSPLEACSIRLAD